MTRSKDPQKHDVLALTVLNLLSERPMHPYEMQRTVRQRNIDEVIGIRPGTLYHAVERLVDMGLVEPMDTHRDGRRPERTVYWLTENGRSRSLAWLRGVIARPEKESPLFLAGVLFLAHLEPVDALVQLDARSDELEVEIRTVEASLERVTAVLPRVLLLEAEYELAMRRAELAWTRAVADDLRAGRLHWDERDLRELGARMASAGESPSPSPSTTGTLQEGTL
jgi:DNA-binding PadR family transcriptional regulator